MRCSRVENVCTSSDIVLTISRALQLPYCKKQKHCFTSTISKTCISVFVVAILLFPPHLQRCRYSNSGEWACVWGKWDVVVPGASGLSPEVHLGQGPARSLGPDPGPGPGWPWPWTQASGHRAQGRAWARAPAVLLSPFSSFLRLVNFR